MIFTVVCVQVLEQAQQIGLISQGYYFLLTSLDAHVVDLGNCFSDQHFKNILSNTNHHPGTRKKITTQ